MEIYLHKTDGGAEYYTTKKDDLSTTVLRTDGDEFAISCLGQIEKAGFKTVRLPIFSVAEKRHIIDGLNALIGLYSGGDKYNKEQASYIRELKKKINNVF